MATTGHLIVTGANNPTSQATPPERKEINDLIQNDPVGFSLFVRAFTKFKEDRKAGDASYFSIAGIHGQPYIAWQGAGGVGDGRAGYCTHTSTIFPTWHRPYLALFEQIIVKHAKDLASELPREWIIKAESLRLPFWDWATNIQPPEEILGHTEQLSILKPDGTTEAVNNPFYRYHFDAPLPSFTRGKTDTDRRPTLSEQIGRNARRDTFLVLTSVDDWDALSNDRATDKPQVPVTSLEQIHNQMHNSTGGFMQDPSISAFDPIFWLHHANVDRVLALWQVLHPNNWVTPSQVIEHYETFNLPVGTTVDTHTPLAPFWDGKSSESFWTSDDVHLTSTFGYTYPELKENPSATQLLKTVTNLYGDRHTKAFATIANSIPKHAPEAKTLRAAAASLSRTNVGDIIPDLRLAAHHTDSFFMAARSVLGALTPGLAQNNTAESEAAPLEEHVEALMVADEDIEEAEAPIAEVSGNRTGLQNWSVRVQFEKFALRTSFDVVIFLLPDDVDAATISTTNSDSWLESEYYVGSVCAFVNSTPEQCPNCVQNIEGRSKIEGFVNLNEAIVDITGLTSFEDEIVHPYLQKNLAWRVRKVSDGSIVPLESIPSLEVTVWSSALLFMPDNTWHLPTFEEPKHHRGITAGQLGGCPAEISQAE